MGCFARSTPAQLEEGRNFSPVLPAHTHRQSVILYVFVYSGHLASQNIPLLFAVSTMAAIYVHHQSGAVAQPPHCRLYYTRHLYPSFTYLSLSVPPPIKSGQQTQTWESRGATNFSCSKSIRNGLIKNRFWNRICPTTDDMLYFHLCDGFYINQSKPLPGSQD